MRSDNVRLLTVATAVEVAQDSVAFEMLKGTFIDGFMQFYRAKVEYLRKEGKTGIPNILEELVSYSIRELPVVVDNCQSLSSLHNPAVRQRIVKRFVDGNLAVMLTQLAKRDVVRNSVRQVLHSKDRHSMHAAIDSNKTDLVFADFMRMFQESCAANYQFTGTFLEYVMHCFVHYYYRDKSIDLWRSIGATDYAKREAETSIGAVEIQRPVRKDDVLIRPLVTNISIMNNLMFHHSVQSSDTKGIHYDGSYMIMMYLVRNRVTSINSKLGNLQLELIDELDHKNDYGDIASNRGIAKKIENGWDLLPVLYERVRQGEWTLDNISELRSRAFTLGKKHRDGKDCIWKDVSYRAETSRYFDITVTPHNYKSFEKVFKGVLSIDALFKALEERGISIVDIYSDDSVLFKHVEICRSIDYLSSLPRLPMMQKLWEESGCPELSEGKGELLTFDEMVYTYAGSDQNKQEHIKAYRQEAEYYGLMDNPRRKLHGDYQTPFTKLGSVVGFFTAIPRSFEEFIEVLMQTEEVLPAFFAPPITVPPSYIVPHKYASVYHNKYFVLNSEMANHYLYKVAMGTEQLHDLNWHVGTSLYPSIVLQQYARAADDSTYIRETFGLYVPMANVFLMCPKTLDDARNNGMLVCQSTMNLQETVVESYYNGQYTAAVVPGYNQIPQCTFSPFFGPKTQTDETIEHALGESMGFDTFLGFETLKTPGIRKKIESIPVYHEYRDSCIRYFDWLADINDIQGSLVDILQMMMSYALFTTRNSSVSVSGVDMRQGQILLESLMKMEFQEENLQWFFDKLEAAAAIMRLQKVDVHWGHNADKMVDFTAIDLRAMTVLTATESPTDDEDSQTYLMYKFLEPYTSIGARFVQLINYINLRLNFLRAMRDSFYLIFGVIISNLDTLGCELNTRFNVEETLISARDAGSFGILDLKCALLDTISMEETLKFAGQVRHDNWDNFQYLCAGILQYFNSCRNNLSALVDYDIVSSPSITSEFKSYGSAFVILGAYTDPMVTMALQDMREKLRTDDSGFFMCRNSYMKSHSVDCDYFIHFTGRILEVKGNSVRPKDFDFSNERDRKLYEEIINNGRQGNV